MPDITIARHKGSVAITEGKNTIAVSVDQERAVADAADQLAADRTRDDLSITIDEKGRRKAQ